ncbi:peptidoglycan-binding domain-containing protein [Bradyrhizobium sp. TZ2]
MLSARNTPRVNVNSVNFAVNRGVVVPPRVNFVSVRTFPSLIEVFPQYRDYSFFVVEDEIVFVDRERRVVDVVPAGPRRHFSRSSTGGRGGGSVAAGGGSVAALDLSEAEIREVELVLIERGLLTGEADGVFDDRTREALITFQRQEGIETSGSIDTRTVATLGLSNKIGQQRTGQSTTEGQSSTAGQGQGQTGDQQQQDQTTGQATGQPQGQRQQNTTGQAAPQNQSQDQSTVGQGRNPPAANQNTQSGQGSGAAPSTRGQGNMQPPAQNPGRNPGSR